MGLFCHFYSPLILSSLSPSLWGGGRVVRRCWVNFQCRGVLLIWIIVGQGSIAFAVRAGGGCLDIFSLIYHFSFLSPSLWETARYRLKYCLKGPLSPKNQPTNHPSLWETARYRYGWLVGCFGLSGPLRQYFSLYMVGCFGLSGPLRQYFRLVG